MKTREFSSSVYVVSENRVLLHRHKRLGYIFPFGGRMLQNELPEDTALREIKEETGLDVVLVRPTLSIPTPQRYLVQPFHMFLQEIREGHQHVDMIFYAICDDISSFRIEEGITEFGWYTKEEIEKMDLFEDVRTLALEALEVCSSIVVEQKLFLD